MQKALSLLTLLGIATSLKPSDLHQFAETSSPQMSLHDQRVVQVHFDEKYQQTLTTILSNGQEYKIRSFEADTSNMTADEKIQMNYTVSYYDYVNEEDGRTYLEVFLRLTNLDASWITHSDGSQGVWMGVGFDTRHVTEANTVVCYLPYKGEDLPEGEEEKTNNAGGSETGQENRNENANGKPQSNAQTDYMQRTPKFSWPTKNENAEQSSHLHLAQVQQLDVDGDNVTEFFFPETKFYCVNGYMPAKHPTEYPYPFADLSGVETIEAKLTAEPGKLSTVEVKFDKPFTADHDTTNADIRYGDYSMIWAFGHFDDHQQQYHNGHRSPRDVYIGQD